VTIFSSEDSTRQGRMFHKWFWPFGWGNVTRLALIYFFSTLYFYLPFGTLYLLSRGLNYVQINSLWGIIVGTMFLTEVPTGILADRLGRKRSIVMALALQLIGELIFIFADRYWLFATSSLIGGLGFAFSSGCVEALVYDSLETVGRQGEMSKAMGFIAAASAAANLLAFAIGGLLVTELTEARFELAIAATICAVAVGWLITFALSESPAAHSKGDRDSSLKLLRDGLRLLRTDRRFARLVLLSLATIPFSNYLGMYQSRLVDVEVPLMWLGLAAALASGLSILGARYVYLLEKWLSPRAGLLLVSGLPGLLFLAAAVANGPLISVVAFCILSGSMSLRGPVFSAHLNQHIENQNRATVLSMISMFSGLYVALMGVLIGYIGDFSLTYAFVFMGVVVLTGSLVLRVD